MLSMLPGYRRYASSMAETPWSSGVLGMMRLLLVRAGILLAAVHRWYGYGLPLSLQHRAQVG